MFSRDLRNRFLTNLALMRENDHKQLTSAQMQYKYDHDKRVPETPVFKTNEVLYDKIPAVVKKISCSKTRDEQKSY